MTDYDVIISGGGPVGMALAIDLGQRGIRTAVIERHPSPQPIPKGQNLTQRTMEHMAAWGCEPALRAARVTPRDVTSGGLVTYGTILSDWSYDWLPREKVAPFYAQSVERLPQYATERVLRDRAAEIDAVDLLIGRTTIGLTQSQDYVEIETDGEDGPSRLTARYAVACDGARSALRDAAGIPQTKTDHDRRMALIVFRSPALHDLLEAQHPTRAFYNALRPGLGGYWLFLGRVDFGEEFFLHAPVPLDATKDTFDASTFLHDAVGQDFPLDIDHLGFWDLRFAVADRYREGRVLLAGDAAHSHPPYGGYGINTGFEDVRNLGWKLAATLDGQAGSTLIDSYGSERRPVFQSLSEDFIQGFIEDDRRFLEAHRPEDDGFADAWGGRNAGDDEVMGFEPNYEGSPIVAADGHPSSRGDHRVSARAGHHLAPQALTDGTDVYRSLGNGFSLIALGADPEPFAAAAEDRGIPLNVIQDDAGEARDAYGAALILVRPDHFVAWCGVAANKKTASTELSRTLGD